MCIHIDNLVSKPVLFPLSLDIGEEGDELNDENIVENEKPSYSEGVRNTASDFICS